MTKSNRHPLQSPALVTALALLCCLLWGSAFPCIKTGYRIFHIAAQDAPSQLLFAGIRFFLAGLLTLAIHALASRKLPKYSGSTLKKTGILALFQTILQYTFFYMGLARTTAVKGSIIIGTQIFLSILLAVFLFRQEKLTGRKVLGCLLGFAGLVLVNLSGGTLSLTPAFGDLLMFLAAAANAFSTVFLKRFSENEDPVVLSGSQFAIGGLVMILIGRFSGGGFRIGSPEGAFLLLYMALISSVAYSVWGLLLKYNPVSRITIFSFSNQVFGVILSAVFLKESQALDLFTLLALVLVSAGILTVNHVPRVEEKGPARWSDPGR